MTRDPYTEHIDEMLRLGGAHECASDCPMPPLPRRAQAVPPLDVERQRIASELQHYDLSDDPGYIRVPTERVRAILAAEREHAAWCYLPKDHQGMCEGDQ